MKINQYPADINVAVDTFNQKWNENQIGEKNRQNNHFRCELFIFMHGKINFVHGNFIFSCMKMKYSYMKYSCHDFSCMTFFILVITRESVRHIVFLVCQVSLTDFLVPIFIQKVTISISCAISSNVSYFLQIAFQSGYVFSVINCLLLFPKDSIDPSGSCYETYKRRLKVT